MHECKHITRVDSRKRVTWVDNRKRIDVVKLIMQTPTAVMVCVSLGQVVKQHVSSHAEKQKG